MQFQQTNSKRQKPSEANHLAEAGTAHA